MSRFSVIIPAYNEEQSIVSVVEAVRFHDPDGEIIVVDDGSTDRTGELAAAAGATVLRHPANGGYGLSLMSGIKAARNDIIVITDADGSYPVGRISELVQKIEEGFDMAVGARQGSHQYDSIWKIPARLLFKALAEFTTGSRIPDINSGLRAFRKSQALPYFADLCRGFSFTTTLTLIYTLTGKFIAYLPIEYHRRVGQSKVRIIRDSLRTTQYMIEVIATYNPLKLYLLLCLLQGMGAVLAFAWWLHDRQAAFLIVASIFVGSSFLLFGIGLLAYLSRK
ncbi:MAG: glycosyltransferase family 2 protein [Isosphaeraceae bacterium]